jgi:hypothetical protein
MFMDMFTGRQPAKRDKPGSAPRPITMTERAPEPLPPRKGGRKAEEAAEGE